MSQEAEEITRRSKSNLAFAFISLPAERRRDMTLFYAFCRVVDDIADDPGRPPEVKQQQLDEWKATLEQPLANPTPQGLSGDILRLIQKYQLPPEHFLDIIRGVEMDLTIKRYDTFEELRQYCYRVASVVGLVSIEIFGYQHPSCRDYAIQLGLALQVTNILRDVGRDLDEDNRIYLPAEDMERFDYSPEKDLVGRVYDRRFINLMDFEAERAEIFYQKACAALHPGDRRSMVAAEIMRKIYYRVLQRMRADSYRVFEKKYRLGKVAKLWIAFREEAGAWLNKSSSGNVEPDKT